MDWLRDWTKRVNMAYVKFAKTLVEKYEFIKTENIVPGIVDGEDYKIPEVYVTGFTVKEVMTEKGYRDKGSVFFTREGLIRIGVSYYPFRFSIPKSQLKEYETDELLFDQTIKITEWAYDNCYMLPYNKIYEQWGYHMKILFDYYNANRLDIMFRGDPNKSIVKEIKSEEMRKEIRSLIKDYKKKIKIKEES